MSILTADEVMRMRAAALDSGAETFWAIAHEVAEGFGVTVEQIKGPRRGPRICRPRHIVCALARRRDFTLKAIGKFLGGRDHTSIMHGAEQGELILAGEK